MSFNSDKRGARLTAAQFFAVGLILFGALSFFFFLVGAILILIWGALCLALYYRLCQQFVSVEKGILRAEKGKWFSLVLRVPITYITGIHIIQTPLAKKLKVCSAIVYSSGLTFILLGIKYTDAEALAALASRGGK